MMHDGPLMELNDIGKAYETPGGGQPLRILDGVSLEIMHGQSVSIMGPSGCGKSTLLHIMGTLDRPTTGRVLLAGTDLGGLSDAQLAAVRNRDIGFVFQSHYLLPQCTVLENVLVPTLPATNKGALNPGPSRDRPAEAPETRARRLLERTGLGGRLDHKPGQLSGGERQRVAVVRALINSPLLLLADEPTGSLDEKSAEEVGALLLELNREERVALVVVTHSPELASRMGRLLRLHEGRLSNSTGRKP